MRRRSRSGGEPAKGPRRKPVTQKRRNAQKAVHRRRSSAAGQEASVARLTGELNAASEQLSAVSEVLKVISSSPGDLKPVFEAILENAKRICEAKFGVLFLSEGDGFRIVAMHGAPPEYAEARLGVFTRERPRTVIGRVAAAKQPAQIADIWTEPDYTSDPERLAILKLAGARTNMGVPMLRGEKLIGVINIFRQEVRPFTDKQIALIQNFAAQAVIAIENTRLLNELRKSLEQQTATSEVLSVISAAPGELDQVFASVLGNAARLCQASFGGLWLRTEDGFRNAVTQGARLDAHTERLKRNPVIVISEHPHAPLAEIARTKSVVHIPDLTKYRGYAERDPPVVSMVESGGVRAALLIPMLKDGVLIGTIAIWRKEIGAFTDKQIGLVQNFAAQAVIAIENARLLNELRESLEQQTATSEVLRVISSSPGDLGPVFQAMLQNAVRICDAKFGVLHRYENGLFHPTAVQDIPPALAEYQRQRGGAIAPLAGSSLDQLMRTKAVVHFADELEERVPGAAARLAGARSLVGVPMLKENELIGAFIIYRQEVRPFTDKQIELVQNFAAQAVIAIENTRLLSELRESLEQQTATANVLGVISSSSGELEPVFNAMLENATRICEAKFGVMFRFDGDDFLPGGNTELPIGTQRVFSKAWSP